MLRARFTESAGLAETDDEATTRERVTATLSRYGIDDPEVHCTLIRAQALGDYEALIESGRKVLRIHLLSPRDIEQVIAALN